MIANARMYSVDAVENHAMRELAAHLGFRRKPDPDVLKGLLENETSLTGQYLSGRRRIEVPGMRRPPNSNSRCVRW